MAANRLLRSLYRMGISAVVVVSFSVPVACGDEETVQASPADLTAFCTKVPDADEEVPTDYVGSAEHVTDMRQLASDAPGEIRSDLDRIVRHFDDDVDPAEPESQMVENFPDEVSAAISRVTGFIDETCDE